MRTLERIRTRLLILVLWSCAAPLSAQQGAAAVAPAAGHGLTVRDGALVGLGRAYRARFSAGRFEILPALGEAAPRDFPLAFRLEEVRRGGALVHRAVDGVEPTREGNAVTYAHGDVILERYEVRAEGVYQSFVFEDLPAGSGDLVVRGRLDTDLAPRPASDGLLFEAAGVGGVSYGAVTGIDAAGRRAAGSLWSDGRAIELTLPARLVDRASFPLVLDPLIGVVIDVNATPFDDRDPDVAWGESGHLVVWERVFSAAHSEVYGQLLDDLGNLVGGPLPLSNIGAGLSRAPAAGYVRGSGNYVVGWSFADVPGNPERIYAVKLNPNLFVISAIGQIVPPVGATELDVGGDRSGFDDEAFFVWREAGQGVRGVLVTTGPGAVPFPAGASFTIDADQPAQPSVHPRISSSARGLDDFLVVWERASLFGNGAIWGRGYSKAGVPLGLATHLSDDPGPFRSDTNPSCDGDGNAFVVAWERAEASPPNGFRDVVCKAVQVHPGGIAVGPGPIVVADDANDDEHDPLVAVTNTSALVLHLDPNILGLGTSLVAHHVDPFTGETFGELDVVATLDFVRSAAIAGQLVSSASSSLDRALAVWSLDPFGSSVGDVGGHLVSSPGTVAKRGGMCGSGGTHFTPVALAGNAGFTAHLRGSTPNATTVLVIGSSELPIACGPCTLRPNLEEVHVVATDAFGDASVPLPLDPSLAGATFYSQWATFVPVGACPLAPLDFSNALCTKIGPEP